MRFISQDDPALSNKQGQPLGSNLYIYCLNNPVMNVDPEGNATESFKSMAARHLSNNSKHWKNTSKSIIDSSGFILTQNKTKGFLFGRKPIYVVKKFWFYGWKFILVLTGYKDLLSDYNGCEWIATYNALKLLGKSVSPADIIYWYEMNGGAVFEGQWGIYPWKVATYFRGQKYRVTDGWNKTDVNSIYNLDERIKKCSVAIITYLWFDKGPSAGAHTVAVKWNASSKTFKIYNEKQGTVLSVSSINFIMNSNNARITPIYYVLIN